jgi:hypothetical protein
MSTTGLDARPAVRDWLGSVLALAAVGIREVEVTIDHVVRGILHVILSTAVLHDDEQRVEPWSLQLISER